MKKKIQTQTTHNQQTKQHTKHRTHRKLNNTNTKRINSIHIEQNKKTQHEKKQIISHTTQHKPTLSIA